MSIKVINHASAFSEVNGELTRAQLTVDGNPVVSHEDEWGLIGKGIVSSRYYQVYRVVGPWCANDEDIYYNFQLGDDKRADVAIEDVATETELTENYKNYYGGGNCIAKVTITVNSGLKTQYAKGARVFIDENEWDINVLNNPVELNMYRNHRITIKWTQNDVEVFKIVKSEVPVAVAGDTTDNTDNTPAGDTAGE